MNNVIKHKKFKRDALLKFLPNNVVAEVGVALGNFSEKILKYNNPKKLILIDAWNNFDLGYSDGNMVSIEEQNQRFKLVRKKFLSNPTVSIIRDKSLPASKQIENNLLDWVYIDADHSYIGCLADLEAYDSKVKKDGYICGHDWLGQKKRGGFGVNEAVKYFVESKGYFLTLITTERNYKSYVISKTQYASDFLLDKINK